MNLRSAPVAGANRTIQSPLASTVSTCSPGGSERPGPTFKMHSPSRRWALSTPNSTTSPPSAASKNNPNGAVRHTEAKQDSLCSTCVVTIQGPLARVMLFTVVPEPERAIGGGSGADSGFRSPCVAEQAAIRRIAATRNANGRLCTNLMLAFLALAVPFLQWFDPSLRVGVNNYVKQSFPAPFKWLSGAPRQDDPHCGPSVVVPIGATSTSRRL